LEIQLFNKYRFTNPIRIISCYSREDIRFCFDQIETALESGYYAAGFASYDENSSIPLIWFGIFEKPNDIDETKSYKTGKYKVTNLHKNISKKEYINKISRIKRLIESGSTYQVNYTFKYKFDFSGSTERLYTDLKKLQQTDYSAFIKTDKFSILSLSPELFFEKKGEDITVRPMKGTSYQDAGFLQKDPKNMSENIMIVDLMRNDLGRFCKTGSVAADKLFCVEKFKTICQMTSEICGKIKTKTSLYDLFQSIFPSGSVTGAPKTSTINIIKELEKEDRNIYTGCIGFFTPNKDAIFNIAIRTILIKGKRGEMGIGSGIVYDSDPEKEFDECDLKAGFLKIASTDFELIETLLWNKNKGFFLLKYHLERLINSADYFGIDIDINNLKLRLNKLKKRLNPQKSHKVRITAAKNGKTMITSSILSQNKTGNKISLSEKRVNSDDIFLYHKTTRRELYDREYKICLKKGYTDVIFTNERGEITEGAISNLIVKKNGNYFTPPIGSGLLNGIYRRYFIKNNQTKEKTLFLDDLLNADKIYICNSVRGIREIIIV